MLSTKTTILAAALLQTVAAYSSYMELIPNGENIGKPLGHTDTGYTDFGTLFSDGGTDWSKVCSETWPGGSVTCGEALGDPCCTWSGSGDPDYTLTEPNTDGTTCASGSTATSTAASTASSAATTTSTASSGTTASTTQDTAAASNSTASADTTDTEDGSYCE